MHSSRLLLHPPISIVNSAAVVMNRTRACSTLSQAALELSGGSAVYAHGSVFLGADGNAHFCSGYTPCPDDAGIGIVSLSGSDSLFLSGSTVRGGDASTFGFCADAADGIHMAGMAEVLDSTVLGGASAGSCPAGVPFTGDVQFLNGTHLSMAVDNPTRESESTLYTFEDPPDVAVYLRYSLFPGLLFRPAQNGFDLLGTPRFEDFIGRTDAEGWLVSREHLGLLPPSYDILHLFVQSYCTLPFAVPPSSPKTSVRPLPARIQLGAGAALSRLDQGF